MSPKLFMTIGALLAALAVAAGAFGAHALRETVSPDRLDVYETSARYHLVHSLALVIIGLVGTLYKNPQINIAGYLMLAGIVLFSGSLYLLVLTDKTWLGAITPFGGVSWIVGWCVLSWGLWRALP